MEVRSKLQGAKTEAEFKTIMADRSRELAETQDTNKNRALSFTEQKEQLKAIEEEEVRERDRQTDRDRQRQTEREKRKEFI